MIKVTLIRPEGCAHCVAVKEVLQKLKKEYKDLIVEEIDMLSEKGQELVQKYNIMASPGILVNNVFFGFGGATEQQFRKKFDEISKNK